MTESEGSWGWGSASGFLTSIAQSSKDLVKKAAVATESLGEKIKSKAVEDVETFVKEKDRCMAEEAPLERESAMPWQFHDPKLLEFEAEAKDIILHLSQDNASFTSSPPDGVDFDFDFERNVDVAQELMAQDPGLSKARFRLVPRAVSEEDFWKNYFYRISVVQDSYRMAGEASTSRAPTEEVRDSKQGPERVAGSTPAPLSPSHQSPSSAEPVAAAAPSPEAAAVAAPSPAAASSGARTSSPVQSSTTSVDPDDAGLQGAVGSEARESASTPAVAAGSITPISDEFVMVEDGGLDDFESALAAALDDPEIDLEHLPSSPTEGDLDDELQRRIEEELELMA